MRRTDDIESDDEREIIIIAEDDVVVVTWTSRRQRCLWESIVVVVHATPLFEEKNGTDAVRRGERTVHFGVVRRTRSRTAHI
jgi:GR25 family glycosyltransferase involved in LPS biosynthesis